MLLNQAQSEYNVAKSGLEAAEGTYRILKQGFKTPIKALLAKLKMKLWLVKQLLLLEEDKVRQATEADCQVRSAIKNQENKIKLPNNYL